MLRRTTAHLAFLSFALSLAASAHAMPLLVELKIKDPIVTPSAAPTTGDPVVSPTGGNGKSGDKGKGGGNEKSNSGSSGNGNSGSGNSGNGNSGSNPGNSGNSNGKSDLKTLTLWISTNGKDWKSVEGDIVELTSDKITARLDTKGIDSADEAMKSFGIPLTNITGEVSQSFFVGLSASATSFAPGSFSAQVVSWQYVGPNGKSITTTPAPAPTSSSTAVPEPSIWSLFATGAIGLGVLRGGRKKR